MHKYSFYYFYLFHCLIIYFESNLILGKEEVFIEEFTDYFGERIEEHRISSSFPLLPALHPSSVSVFILKNATT